jgi:glutamyl-tRNA(Gln) amidotransferase subunit D
VALVKYHPGYDPKLLNQIIDNGYKGIIFEGTGLGHIGKIMYDSVKKANERGIFLGMTSQCIDGRIGMTVYESGRDLLDLGIIPLENMIPEVALVKAMWAIGNFQTIEEVKKIMLQNIASELTN